MLELSENNKNESGIYCITNSINNKVYIGSTICFFTRKRQHFIELKGGYHNNPKLQNFVNKYGIDTLSFYILETCTIDTLLEREQWYLDNTENKFNICIKADKPNVYRQFTEKDIQDIATFYNSGKCSTEISRLYFGKKDRQQYITSIIKGEIYSEYKHLFKEYKPRSNKSFTEVDINKIAELYNSGKTSCQISEILYGNRNSRAKINQIVSGKIYKEYSALFNYRKYTQVGRACKEDTKNKISNANKGKKKEQRKERKGNGKLSKEIVLFIRQNPEKITQQKLADRFTISKSLIKDIQKRRTYNKF